MATDGTDVRQFPLTDAVGAAGWAAGGKQILFTDIVNAGDVSPGFTWIAVMDAAGTTLSAVTRSNGCCSWYAVQQPTP